MPLYSNIYCQIHTEALPKVQCAFRTTIPTVWKVSELQKAKESIDLGNPTGKRDYAIIMVAAGTGLRAGDIINLKLSDIGIIHEYLVHKVLR